MTTPVFDPHWTEILAAPFMRNAMVAGLCIAVAAGAMGYFTIARHSTFAAHALAHIGLPGATGAVLLGLPVSAGMGLFALGGALVIGALGKRASQREIATGTVLAFATGLGLFFARMSSSASQQMQAILFGSILTITRGQVVGFIIFDVILLILLALIYRPLLFSSLDEQVAQARGVPIGLMNLTYMAIMAGVITIAGGLSPAGHASIGIDLPGFNLGRPGDLGHGAGPSQLRHRDPVHPLLGSGQGMGRTARLMPVSPPGRWP